MRALVLVLAGMAGLKIWAHDHVYRSAAEDALVAAYRDRAIEACQKDRSRAAKSTAGQWSQPAAVRLVMGKRDVEVAFWDVDNPLWAVRYKYPVLVLTTGATEVAQTCEFDVTLGTAAILKPRG
jgi:hypothetical protein